ncbi:MAG: mycothiol synthase [Actinobacteria bacterium]|nr:mycothiol synthase [Actinomycetota bacterium]MCA1720521.1 mycothiol synthase [Actinomycetota bacterium]
MIDVCTRLSAEAVADVRELVDAVTAADGAGPLSEHVMLHLPRGGDADVRHLLVRQDAELVGYAHVDVTDEVAGPSAELAVHPSARGQGTGRALVEQLLELTPRLRLWAHGEHPAAARLATSMGFTRTRVLWQMRRPLGDALPEPVLPQGVELRTFEVGLDEQAWTTVNNRAFADHPDQGRWGVEEVLLREAEAWFDPKGFFLACRGNQLVGFHWTKVHGVDGHDHPPVGEVYVVGVDPSEQGRGLGPALTLIGLRHLQQLGLDSVILYVDEANTNAIRVYERLGFARSATDVCWSLG